MLHHFFPTGRIGRWSYVGQLLAFYALGIACYSLPALAEYQLHDTAAYWENLALAGMVLCFYLLMVQMIKRLHDLNMRGWWLLLALVPIAGSILGNGMVFVSGTNGPNKFGPAPGQVRPTPIALT